MDDTGGRDSSTDLARFLQRQVSTYELDTDWRGVPEFVEVLLETHRGSFAEGRADQLALALRELLFNAIEHGTLGLGYARKSAALQDGQFQQLLDERAQLAPFVDRRVVVVVRTTSEELEIEIEDQGAGFDWRGLPNPLDPANLLEDHGRGVLLARLSVDALSYNDAGNVVTVRKRFAE
jgi:anti-sigma regulatory factor (Ser/Thr protein kinase)